MAISTRLCRSGAGWSQEEPKLREEAQTQQARPLSGTSLDDWDPNWPPNLVTNGLVPDSMLTERAATCRLTLFGQHHHLCRCQLKCLTYTESFTRGVISRILHGSPTGAKSAITRISPNCVKTEAQHRLSSLPKVLELVCDKWV